MENNIIVLQDKRRAHLEVWNMTQMGFPCPSSNSHFLNFSEYRFYSSTSLRSFHPNLISLNFTKSLIKSNKIIA